MPRAQALVVCCLLLLHVGCSRDGGTATGTVTYDGQRMTKGMVTFHPAVGGADAYATIAANGTFEAMTGTDVGLKTGEYVVTIVDQTIPESGSGDEVKVLTPAKYASPTTTDLKVTIQAGANRFDFQLKK